MAKKFSQFVYKLPGFVTQVTEGQYSILLPRYDLLSDKAYFVPTCPVLPSQVTYLVLILSIRLIIFISDVASTRHYKSSIENELVKYGDIS